MSSPLVIAIVVIVIIILSGIRIAQEYQRGVVFRLGRYTGLRGPGLYWIIPLGIERAVTIDIRTRTVSAEQQETITRDSVTVKLNAVLWYRVTDAAKSVISVADAPGAVYQLAGPAQGWISMAPQSLGRAQTKLRRIIRPVQQVQRSVDQAVDSVGSAPGKSPRVVVQ